MINLFFKPILLIFLLICSVGTSTKIKASKNKNLVKTFIKARNDYDIEKVGALIDEGYSETFIDGSKEIENKDQLIDRVLWGKELESRIKLLDIQSNGKTIITIEESSNFIDIALKRKPRKFIIIYGFVNGKIHHQSIDTLAGYHLITKYNAGKYKEFAAYCEQNNLIYNGNSLNQEFGMHLRKVLEQYRTENE